MVYYKDIEFIEKEDSIEAFCVWEAGGSPWKYERKGHQILGRDLPHLWNISGSKHSLQWSTMITSYKSRGKPLKVQEEGSTVWLLYIFCWKDVLHFKVNDLVSEGGSLLKFEGRISGDPTNWLLCNDFRKENFFAPLLKISSSEGLESTEERLSERSIGCFLNLFHGRKIRVCCIPLEEYIPAFSM